MNRSMLSSAFIRVFSMVLMLSLYLVATQAFAEQKKYVEGIDIKNPGADLWREVRQREMNLPGTTQARGVDAGILINAQGDQWARFRVNTVAKIAMYVLGGVIVLILLFYLIRGKVKIKGGLSGNMVFRYTDFERVVHWVLAFVFLFLAITGLILLLGRSVLIPLLGHDLFSILASSSKEAHNLFGPIFLVSLILMLIQFMRRNIYEKGDLTWLLKGGGMIGKSHVTGGFFNMGEKSWYWLVIIIGLAISVSGLILVSPGFGQNRHIMELSHLVHAGGAIILIAVSFGHIYLGTVGTEGTKEAMKNGYVDIRWAEEHHDRWAKKCHDNNAIISAEEYAALKGETARHVEEGRS